MKFSSIIVALLLHHSAHAAEGENGNVAKDTSERRLRKHKRERKGPSENVRYFTLGGQTSVTKSHTHQHHHGRSMRTRIVGGSESDPYEFPYYVDMDGCGGSLIAPDVILSAAHCGDYTGERVLVGAYRRDSTNFGAVRVKVEETMMHPNYDNVSEENDVMVLRLASPVTSSSSVNLLINDEYNIPANGADLTVLGLGDLVEDGAQPTNLMDVVVKAVDTDQCNRRDAYDGEVVDSVMFCAVRDASNIDILHLFFVDTKTPTTSGVQGGGKDSCHGDSGGPIVKRVNSNTHLQVGIVSWGYGCAEAEYPGVYTRISGVYDWITSVACDDWQADGPLCGNGGGGGGGNDDEDDDNSGGGGGGTCGSSQLEFDFTIRTDDYGDETSWELTRGGSVVLSGEDYSDNRAYRTEKCIPRDCYSLTIFDSYGDGLSEGGNNPGYRLQIDGQTIEEAGGEDFGDSTTMDFGSCSGSGGGGGNDDDNDDDNNNGGGGGGGSSCIDVNFELRTDDYGDETDFFLLSDNGQLIWDEWGFGDNQVYQYFACLPSNGCATLDVYDSYGDGISSPGKIKLTVDGTVKYNSGNIGDGIVFRIGGGC
eukprot:scaffold869_cov150-Cylindrotheca_fusiformis.AAC.3